MAKTSDRNNSRAVSAARTHTSSTKKKKKASAKKKRTPAKPRTPKPRAADVAARRDQRYKDQHNAPTIVSERRLTFFLPAALYSEMRRLTGLAQAENADAGASRSDDNALPESPSALLREAVEHYLDQARPKAHRPPREWQARIKQLRALMTRHGR